MRARSTRVVFALLHDDHWIGIFVEVSKSRYRIYKSFGTKHPSNDYARDAVDRALQMARDNTPDFT